MRLTGHKVLVTGGNSGVGFELARAFVERGNGVVISGRDEARLRRAAEELGVGAIQADLSDDADLRRLVVEARERLDGLTVLVNNAAVQFNHGWTGEETERILRDADLEVRTDLLAPLKLAALCLPLLREASEGAIVNVTTGLALAPKASAPVYCASKAGLRVFGRALRYQLQDAGSGVRVFEAMLPLVDTAMTQGRGNKRLKIPPERAAREVLRGMERDRYEIHVGAARALLWLDRLAPPLAARLMRNGI